MSVWPSFLLSYFALIQLSHASTEAWQLLAMSFHIRSVFYTSQLRSLVSFSRFLYTLEQPPHGFPLNSKAEAVPFVYRFQLISVAR